MFLKYQHIHDDFCSLKKPIISFDILANAIGDCTGDAFIVSNVNNNVPIICGENSGQHSKKILCRSSENMILNV